jgi:hypothetical protein
MPCIITVEWPESTWDTLNELMEIPFGRRAAIRRMIGDRGGETEDKIAVTRDPADDRPVVMAVVSVAMPLLADCALAVIDFSAMVEMRYDGKIKTEAIKMASEIKKRKTIKNLVLYSVLRTLTVFGGRRAWYIGLI